MDGTVFNARAQLRKLMTRQAKAPAARVSNTKADRIWNLETVKELTRNIRWAAFVDCDPEVKLSRNETRAGRHLCHRAKSR